MVTPPEFSAVMVDGRHGTGSRALRRHMERLAASLIPLLLCSCISYPNAEDFDGGLADAHSRAVDMTSVDAGPSWRDCYGNEVDTRTDPANCGNCGVVCDEHSQRCVSGECAFKEGFAECGLGHIVDIRVDGNNCGECANACDPAGQDCVSGRCVLKEGFSDCDGRYVNVEWDASDCGLCGHSCLQGAECRGGVCVPRGSDLCDGRVVSVMDDSLNCGSCSRSCEGGRCVLGECQVHVLAEWAETDDDRHFGIAAGPSNPLKFAVFDGPILVSAVGTEVSILSVVGGTITREIRSVEIGTRSRDDWFGHANAGTGTYSTPQGLFWSVNLNRSNFCCFPSVAKLPEAGLSGSRDASEYFTYGDGGEDMVDLLVYKHEMSTVVISVSRTPSGTAVVHAMGSDCGEPAEFRYDSQPSIRILGHNSRSAFLGIESGIYEIGLDQACSRRTGTLVRPVHVGSGFDIDTALVTDEGVYAVAEDGLQVIDGNRTRKVRDAREAPVFARSCELYFQQGSGDAASIRRLPTCQSGPTTRAETVLPYPMSDVTGLRVFGRIESPFWSDGRSLYWIGSESSVSGRTLAILTFVY